VDLAPDSSCRRTFANPADTMILEIVVVNIF